MDYYVSEQFNIQISPFSILNCFSDLNFVVYRISTKGATEKFIPNMKSSRSIKTVL